MTDLHVRDTDEPDFESLYGPHVDGDGWRMTPRMASHLWGAATILGDEWRTCMTDPELLAENLPPVARPYAQNRSWLEQFIESFDRLAERLCVDGDSDCLARCTAKELALHLTINTAEAYITDGVVDSVWADHLPDHGSADQDFDWMRQVLFEDHDVLMLFNPPSTGSNSARASAPRTSTHATGSNLSAQLPPLAEGTTAMAMPGFDSRSGPMNRPSGTSKERQVASWPSLRRLARTDPAWPPAIDCRVGYGAAGTPPAWESINVHKWTPAAGRLEDG